MTDRDKYLRWHKARIHPTKPGTIWRAWAPKINPDQQLLPYYRLTVIMRVWTVNLVTYPSEGPQRTMVAEVRTLTEAKVIAQHDYETRTAELVDNT